MARVRSKDLLFLRFLAEYRVVTIQQIAAVFEICRRADRKRVDKFHSDKLISIIPINFGRGKGRPENIIIISKNGVDLLCENEVIDPKITSDRILFNDYSRISHELLINWFRIHLKYLQKRIPVRTDFISPTTPFSPLYEDGSPYITDKVTIDALERKFIPDGVFSISHSEQKKRLLFFLEVDMGTESITSTTGKSDTIQQKIMNYHAYFRNNGYKRYQKKWECELNVFRVLFVTNTTQHKEIISRFLRESRSNDFVWVTDQKQIFQHGLGANIWARGGDTSPPQSILGLSLAQELPIPSIQE